MSYAVLYALITAIWHPPIALIKYVTGGSFDECVCYIALYFAVGVLFSAISGRVLTAVLGCLSYYLGSGLVCYVVIGLQPCLPKGNGGLASLICAPFIHNAPIFNIFYRIINGGGVIIVNGNWGFDNYIVFSGFIDSFSIFGILSTAALFYILSICIFKHRRVEELDKPYCFPFVAPTITSALAVECYFLAVIAPWGGLDKAVERVKNVFSVGRLLPGTEYITVFVVAFFVFSALSNCGARHVFKYLKLLPTLAVATYFFQIVLFGDLL